MENDFELLACCVYGGFFLAFLIWLKFYRPYFFKKYGVSRWSGFKKKTDNQILKETAQKFLAEGTFNTAENLFTPLLKTMGDDLKVRLGLAESLYGQAMLRGLRKNLQKKAGALEQYQWVLDYYLRERHFHEATTLYRRLLGPYSADEIGIKFKALIRVAAETLGTVVVHAESDRVERVTKLHDEFNAFESAGKFLQAQAVLEDILKFEDIVNLEPSFLSRAGEVCLQAKRLTSAEKLFESVAKRGDAAQTARALEVLAQFWLETPKQIHLTVLYKGTKWRLATLDEFPKWVELGEKLGA